MTTDQKLNWIESEIAQVRHAVVRVEVAMSNVESEISELANVIEKAAEDVVTSIELLCDKIENMERF